ncbi:19939_t:CDS:2, partial [Gigaspora rosea]
FQVSAAAITINFDYENKKVGEIVGEEIGEIVSEEISEVIPASPMPGFDPLWETENDFNEVLMTYDI